MLSQPYLVVVVEVVVDSVVVGLFEVVDDAMTVGQSLGHCSEASNNNLKHMPT